MVSIIQGGFAGDFYQRRGEYKQLEMWLWWGGEIVKGREEGDQTLHLPPMAGLQYLSIYTFHSGDGEKTGSYLPTRHFITGTDNVKRAVSPVKMKGGRVSPELAGICV